MILFVSALGTAAVPEIYPDSPQQSTTVNGTIQVTAFVNDPDNGTITGRFFRVLDNGTQVAEGSYNTTFDTTTLENGKHSFRFFAEDNQSETNSTTVSEVDFANPATVDDGKNATNTSFGTPIAFIGSLLEISGEDSVFYNLTTSAGNLVDEGLGSSKLNTSGTVEDRHSFRAENGSADSKIDLVKDSSDVTGRINAGKSSVQVEVLSWLEGKLVTGSPGYAVSKSDWPPSGGS